MAESIYVFASVFAFATFGLMTGWLHGHGNIAGAVSGGLSGLILALMVPALLGVEFMRERRRVQYVISAIAFVLMLSIVLWMYRHVIL